MSENQKPPAERDEPLFQNIDAQEQVYAPDQVPGTQRPEADEGRDPDSLPFGGVLPAVPAGGVAGGRVAPVPPVLAEPREDENDEPRSGP